jgi:lipid-A-disaccharide synthase
MSEPPAILFTAFEPSGDLHAAAVIAQLRRTHPDVQIYAWGGHRMERAGAEVLERTGENAVMGLPGIEKIREHRRLNERIGAWMRENKVRVHVPVDSPAANFPICSIAKGMGVKVVHLVAPQVWAWGTWRIRKLRRLTDLVLCLLPFEEGWFTTRGVPARFIGHPLFDEPLDFPALDEAASSFPDGKQKLALMPGSRPSELTNNFPLMLEAFRRLKAVRPGLTGLIASINEPVDKRLRAIAGESGGWPEGLHSVADMTDAVIRWADVSLVVSGTVTLQIAKQGCPMVVFYKSNPVLYYCLAKWLLSTRYFALPNLIAGREVVPELIPHFGGAPPIASATGKLFDSPEQARIQREDLGGIVERFQGKRASEEAAREIAAMAGLNESQA